MNVCASPGSNCHLPQSMFIYMSSPLSMFIYMSSPLSMFIYMSSPLSMFTLYLLGGRTIWPLQIESMIINTICHYNYNII